LVRGRHRLRLLVELPRAFHLSAYLRDWLAEAPKPKGSINRSFTHIALLGQVSFYGSQVDSDGGGRYQRQFVLQFFFFKFGLFGQFRILGYFNI
jgi:hypothetical protein